MKGFALGLALKQRRKATRKSPIHHWLILVWLSYHLRFLSSVWRYIRLYIFSFHPKLWLGLTFTAGKIKLIWTLFLFDWVAMLVLLIRVLFTLTWTLNEIEKWVWNESDVECFEICLICTAHVKTGTIVLARHMTRHTHFTTII